MTAGPLSGGKVSYLFITVHSFQRMLSFYRDLLGFRVNYIQEGECVFLYLPDGIGSATQIALYAGRELCSEYDHHWFMVIDVKDIEASVTELRSLGVEVGEIVKVPYGKAAKLVDPEGNIIEIHESVDF